MSQDPATFIVANTRLTPIRSFPEISIHAAHQGSGLRRLAEASSNGADLRSPYWAFAWAGGLVLARHLLAQPETVLGRRVLDLGTGSGLVAIAAAMAGASEVVAADTDPYALAAARLNATANGVALTVLDEDVVAGPPPAVDLVLAGDVFYGAAVARRMVPFFDSCIARGIDVLVGDPGRAFLPRGRLEPIAEYVVPDMGEPASASLRPSAVYAFRPKAG